MNDKLQKDSLEEMLAYCRDMIERTNEDDRARVERDAADARAEGAHWGRAGAQVLPDAEREAEDVSEEKEGEDGPALAAFRPVRSRAASKAS